MSQEKHSPGIASLLLFGGRILFAVTLRFITAPLRWHNWNGAPTLFKDVFYTGVRTMLAIITIPQSRYIYPSTVEAYVKFCKDTKQEPNCVTFNDVPAVWIGEKGEDADVVILYLHGGGYTQPCQYGYYLYLDRLTKNMEADQETTKSVSVLLVAYTLVPEAHYPAQLNQAATVLSYLLSDKKRDPASVIIGGDSAGGNLAISLLSHILHPRPGTPRVSLTAPLRGVMICSPWVSFSTKHDSYLRNAGKDTLVDSMLRAWGSMYLGLSKDGEVFNEEVETDSYNEPLRNGPDWWEGMHEVVNEVFMWMGSDEVFIDGLRDFTKVFTQGWKAGGGISTAVKSYEATGQPHIGPIMDVLMEDKNKSRSQLDIEEWFKKLLGKKLSTKI